MYVILIQIKSFNVIVIFLNRKRGVPGIYSLFVICTIIFRASLALYAFICGNTERDTFAIAQNMRLSISAGIGLFVAIFLYKNSTSILQCFLEIQNTETAHHKEDLMLPTIINSLVTIVMISAVFENALSHSNVFIINLLENNRGQNVTLLESYWKVHYTEFGNTISYNATVAVILFISNKLAYYVWNFGDVFTSVMAILIYRKFKFQNQAMMEILNTKNGKGDQKMWLGFVEDHGKLVVLIEQASELLSPLIFVCTFANIFFVGIHISYFLRRTGAYDVMQQEHPVWRQVYVIWAFVHLVVRSLGTILLCARVNEHAHQFSKILGKCPVQFLNKEVKYCSLLITQENQI